MPCGLSAADNSEGSMMASDAQILANRKNAQKSTGWGCTSGVTMNGKLCETNPICSGADGREGEEEFESILVEAGSRPTKDP
jgi:hypothetical protein